MAEQLDEQNLRLVPELCENDAAHCLHVDIIGIRVPRVLNMWWDSPIFEPGFLMLQHLDYHLYLLAFARKDAIASCKDATQTGCDHPHKRIYNSAGVSVHRSLGYMDITVNRKEHT